MEGTVKRRYVK